MVVRRLVPGETGPTGGPAFTDVLGVCTSWADGVCVVRPETGDPVAIPVELIVSGKPVPPRPSVRHRVSVRDAELHTASLVPGVVTEPLGEWQLRYEPSPAGRIRNRFNSCLGIGDPGVPLADAAATVRRFYGERDRPPRIQVELGSGTEDALHGLGWEPVPGRDAHFLLASLARAKRLCGAPRSPDDRGAPQIVEDGPHAAAVLAPGGSEAARCEAGLEGDWLGLHHLRVSPDRRRQGLATAVVRTLLEWGAEQGATTVWLHVATGNAPALRLYEKLGFAVHHTCRYLGTVSTGA